MKKYCAFILLFFSLLPLFAQQELLVFHNTFEKSKLKEVVPVINEINGDFSLFFLEAKRVNAYLFNKEFDSIKSLSVESKGRKYKNILGNSIANEMDYRIYLMNDDYNKFATINFSFTTKNSSFEELDLDLGKEKFIQSVTYNNRFYLITAIENTSNLIVYSFDDNAKYTKKTIDFSQEEFINPKGEKENLFELFKDSQQKNKINILKIQENNPNSIETTSKNSKFYLRGNEVVFSFDYNMDFTQIISLNLETFDYSYNKVEKPFFDLKSSKKLTNSFLFGDHIFLIGASDDAFTFQIKDFKSKELLLEYTTAIKDSINFKNTAIIQEGATYDGYRELDKTSQFIRKISREQIGVSVYSYHNELHITLGGAIEVKSGAPMMMGGPMLGVSTGLVSFYFNPTYFAYNSYSNTKSIYFISKFDPNFKHKTGEIEKNAFDKIKDINDASIYEIEGECIFKYNDYYIQGSYDPDTKEYQLLKFVN